MFYLRLYELTVLHHGHVTAAKADYLKDWPSFLNVVNRYYGYRVWH